MNTTRNARPHRRYGRPVLWSVCVLTAVAHQGIAVYAQPASPFSATLQVAAVDEAFDGEFAMSVLRQICDLGPRISGTQAMRRQQELLKAHFEFCQGQVGLQTFTAVHPLNNQRVELANLIVRWHPERKRRIMFCCHYDTRPLPDRDRIDPQGLFLGANDGASGVGWLAELGRHMPALAGKYGVDIVFFDAEELVYLHGRDPMFLGSTHFANEYAARRWDVQYDYAILVDMIGDADLQVYFEGNSLRYAQRLTKSIWAVAKELGVTEFIAEKRHEIRDDHLPLNIIAKIPTCDVIDFDFPNPQVGNIYWHTREDVPDRCSADSLEKVGRVLLEWTRQLQKL
ncbi:MAG TPA: M28 family peptidase [Pirellulaceae bacterium]|nr:M28 family peptidase [Pirellulaceae bacterium]